MRLLQEYRASLKSIEVEEVADLLFFRPLAFVLVKLLYYTPLTPNQISLLSMCSGIAAGVVLASGTQEAFLIAGVLLLLAQILDCCDGMIARMKGTGSKTGRIIDGGVDYITAAAAYIGLFVGLSKLLADGMIELPLDPLPLVLLYALCHAIHAMLSDHYKNRYDYHVYGKSVDPASQLHEFEEELQHIVRLGGRYFDRIIIRVYLFYTRIQAGKSRKTPVSFDSGNYAESNRIIVFLWSFIGASEHILLLAISLILFDAMIYALYVLVIANVWSLLLLIIQITLDRRLLREQATAV
jgi:hypothetical protein